MAEYDIVFTRSARKELEQLPADISDRILRKIRELANDPRPHGARKLSGTHGLWRLRVGDYRIVYEILKDAKMLEVGRIRHRRDVYRDQ